MSRGRNSVNFFARMFVISLSLVLFYFIENQFKVFDYLITLTTVSGAATTVYFILLINEKELTKEA